MKVVLRRHKLLLMSLMLGICAFSLSYSLLSGHVQVSQVVVAARDQEPYHALTPADVILMEIPVKGVPKGALSSVADAVGQYTRSRLVAGQMVMAGHVIRNAKEVGLSYDLPAESRGMFLPVPASRAVGGRIREGERVDVIVAEKNAVSYGRESSPAFTAVSGLLVYEVVKDERSEEFFGVVVLALPQDCERLATYLEDADLYLVLVPKTLPADALLPNTWGEP